VVLIGVDGFGIRNIAWDRMPNLRKLRDNGMFAVARSTFPTSSGVNWSSALCGTTPDLHGVRDNTPKPQVQPALATPRGNHPCIFSEIRRQEPKAYTCSLYDWNGIGWYHDSASANFTKLYPSNFESESKYTDEFIELLKKNNPRLAFITYDMCDHTGHAQRYDSPEYANTCAQIDGFIGRIADYVAANMAKDTAIMLFSDHGGHDKGHGDTTLECYEIPFLVYAPDLDGFVFREPVTISDVAPTVAWLLGLEIPDFWRGRPALRPSATYPLQKRLVVHAGKGNGAPENTLPAFKAAVATGFGFECDIQMSADHQIFAAHNASAKAYSGKDIPFKTMPWSEIEKIDVGRRLGGVRWAGTPPPRFEDILALMRDGRKSFVEVKESAGTEIVPYIKAAVEAQSNATADNMLFISFDREICRALRKALPKYEVLWIVCSHKDLERPDDCRGPAYTADEVIALLKDANLTGVDMSGDVAVVTEEFVRKVKSAGFKFGVWTVDDTKAARIFFERGVDAVTTNRSKEIAEELQDWKWPNGAL
jgi:glycerophosphoryl diester phosphodiesterase